MLNLDYILDDKILVSNYDYIKCYYEDYVSIFTFEKSSIQRHKYLLDILIKYENPDAASRLTKEKNVELKDEIESLYTK